MQSDKAVIEAITSKVWAIVNALPHRAAIVESDARFWVEEVVARYGDLATWHAVRAGGFGGSQIGALVKNYLGERADYEQSATDIVSSALLKKLPDQPNSHMRRGIAMESNHRKWFYGKYGCARNAEAFTALANGTGPRPWMRYSPDDLVTMKLVFVDSRLRGDGLVLVDFKAPNSVGQSKGVAFQYGCQLHLGAMIARHNNVPVAGMILSQFDWANWTLRDDSVDRDEETEQVILQAGDHFWSFVERGEVPPYVRKQRVDQAIEAQIREEVGPSVEKLARLKSMISALQAEEEKFEEVVNPVIRKVRFGGARLRLDGLGYTGTPKFDVDAIAAVAPEGLLKDIPLSKKSTKRYDEKAMLAKLKELNVQTKQFVLPGNLDSDALYDALVEHGVDADALMVDQPRATLDPTYKNEGVAWLRREHPDLLAQTDVVSEVHEAPQQDDREGQETPRYAPRSVSA